MKIGGPIAQRRRRQQDGKCFLCGGKLHDYESRDHLVPTSKGGSDGWSNIVLAHPPCNNRKADKMPTQHECERFRKMTGHWPSPQAPEWDRAEALYKARGGPLAEMEGTDQ